MNTLPPIKNALDAIMEMHDSKISWQRVFPLLEEQGFAITLASTLTRLSYFTKAPFPTAQVNNMGETWRVAQSRVSAILSSPVHINSEKNLHSELTSLLTRYASEANPSYTDSILAEFLLGCLDCFKKATYVPKP